MTEVPQTPILGHVEGVELIDTGTWAIMSGAFNPSTDDIASAVAAMDCPAVRRPVLKAGHTEETGGQHGVGEPALGYVANLRTANEGHTLVGDFRGMPGWLTAVDDDGSSILSSAYPDRSIEGEYDYVCQLGHQHPFVVHAVALLGVERPGIGTLESLQELYGVVAAAQPSGPGDVVNIHRQEDPNMPPAPRDGLNREPYRITAAATTDDVRRAYYAGPGQDWDLWIREMYVDPPELIVDNDADGSILRIPYTTAENGDVEFGDPQKVKVTYVAARAGAGKPVAAWNTKTESRPGGRPADPAPPTNPSASTEPGDPSEPGEEPAVAFSDEQLKTLRQKLGTDENADEATILEALDQALEERADPPPNPEDQPQIPEGMQVIETSVLEDLQVAARAGQTAREQQLTERRDREIEAAIKAGKTTPARREHWEAAWKADPDGTSQTLASLAPGLVPTEFAGTPGSPDATSDDALYESLFGKQTQEA